MIVLWAPEAEQDRIDIMDYIAADNPAATIRICCSVKLRTDWRTIPSWESRA